MKIKSITFNKIKKLPWILKQPLAKIPKNKFSVISDLFVWRKTMALAWREWVNLKIANES